MVNYKVNIGKGVELKNPILTASGTFGYGTEFAPYTDLNQLGGYIVKGTTLIPRQGNPYPRMAETPSGMLNAVGLQNKGVDYFIDHIYPTIKEIDSVAIVNVSGSDLDTYRECAKRINDRTDIKAIEVNISCPNVKEGGMSFGVTCQGAAEVTQAVREVFDGHMMVKLSPNVTDIVSIARSVEDAGADSVSLINTLLGMAIDAKTCRPMLSTITGGLSGPCVKPVALRMVWQVANAVKIPVIGLGGISNVEDVVEFLLAGATAVQIGTYNFIDPAITGKLVTQLEEFMTEQKIDDVQQLIGGMIV